MTTDYYGHELKIGDCILYNIFGWESPEEMVEELLQIKEIKIDRLCFTNGQWSGVNRYWKYISPEESLIYKLSE